MDEKERQKMIAKYAKDEWKDDPENVVVLKLSNAGGVSEQLGYLTSVGYDEAKVVIAFPEGYSVEDLEAGKPEPEGTIWYLVYHKNKSSSESRTQKNESKGA